jgi:tellurite methyltransferase
MSLSLDYQRHWPDYFHAVRGQPPRDTCIRALDLFEQDDAQKGEPVDRWAIDIAAGEGRDSLEVLRRSGPTRWRVTAIEPDAAGRAGLVHAVPESDRPRLIVMDHAMEALPTLSPRALSSEQGAHAQADLINASFALPFCHEDRFPHLWAWIVALLKPGGRFCGQFFGDRDEWASINPRRHHSRIAVLALLHAFEVEHMDEVEKDGSDAMGGTKHHHVFHVVAQKNG